MKKNMKAAAVAIIMVAGLLLWSLAGNAQMTKSYIGLYVSEDGTSELMVGGGLIPSRMHAGDTVTVNLENGDYYYWTHVYNTFISNRVPSMSEVDMECVNTLAKHKVSYVTIKGRRYKVKEKFADHIMYTAKNRRERIFLEPDVAKKND